MRGRTFTELPALYRAEAEPRKAATAANASHSFMVERRECEVSAGVQDWPRE
jgi:hypothetical protein